jgi:hypothetical protein
MHGQKYIKLWLLVFGQCCGYINGWGTVEGALLGHFFSVQK